MWFRLSNPVEFHPPSGTFASLISNFRGPVRMRLFGPQKCVPDIWSHHYRKATSFLSTLSPRFAPCRPNRTSVIVIANLCCLGPKRDIILPVQEGLLEPYNRDSPGRCGALAASFSASA